MAVKFPLYGYVPSLDIFPYGYPTTQEVSCTSGDPLTGQEASINLATSSLIFASNIQQYVFTFKMEPAWAGTCRRLSMHLINDQTLVKYFRVE